MDTFTYGIIHIHIITFSLHNSKKIRRFLTVRILIFKNFTSLRIHSSTTDDHRSAGVDCAFTMKLCFASPI